jgi:amino acid transporter
MSTGTSTTTPAAAGRMSVRGAAFLGVGAMVGAGIFALLGEAGAVAGSAVWLSFLLGGIVATLLGYVVAKLGARYPSSGGIVTFLVRGFGKSHLTGTASWLLYFSALIVTAMVAVSFGSYATALLVGDGAAPVWDNVFTTAVIVAVAAVQLLGATFIDRIQSLIVVVLLAVFGVFVVVTLGQVDSELLAPSTYPSGMTILSSVALTFFAYLGFAVISFTGGDLENPRKNLPRAMYLALAITTVLYVLVAIGVFGTLTVDEVIANGETALAEAARPVLGDAGFAMMAVAALLATSSSVNANVYGAVGSTAQLAQVGQFPPIFGRPGRFGSTQGLTVSTVLVLLLANLVDLSAIASIGSVVALAIFTLVAVVGLRLRREAGINVAVTGLAIVVTLIVLLVFLADTLRTSPETFVGMVAVLVLAVVLEFLWSAVARRRSRDTGSPAAGAQA